MNQRMKGMLHAGERVVESSQRRPHKLSGWICLLTGVIVAMEVISYLRVTPGLTALLPLSAGLIYFGIWLLAFCGREGVCVTNERVVWLKVNALGQAGKAVSIPFNEIESVRLYRTSVSYLPKARSGSVTLQMVNGRGKTLPLLENGEYVMEAIGVQLANDGTIPVEHTEGGAIAL